MKKALVLSLFLILMLTFTACNQDNTDKYEVIAPTGTYVGHDSNGVAEFLGISYSDPIEKWQEPSDVTTTEKDIIECDEWGPSCSQVLDDVETASSWTQSYDCLDLNIWTKDVTTTGKPVMVFIHGGGGWQGGTYDPLYDGENYIRNITEGEDAIMITINYRLGMYGSLDLSLLEGYTDKYENSINLATLDMIQALKWINSNISSFGGDPNNVTVMGQSFGAGSVCTLLTIPEATQYFQNAILESGNIFNRQVSIEKAKENSQKAFDILGVSTVDELLAISDEEMAEKYVQIDEELHHPHRVADGKIIPIDGYAAIKEGSAKGINVMMGTVSGEYDWLGIDWDKEPYKYAITDPESIFEEMEIMKNRSGDLPTSWSPLDYPEIMEEYMSLDSDKIKRACDLYNDTHYRQTGIFIAEALISGGANVYMYYWEWAPDVDSVIETSGESAEVSPWGRPMHCLEQILVFDVPEDGYPELGGPAEGIPEELTKQTQSTWYSFSKNGSPDNELIPSWTKYNTTDRPTMVISPEGEWSIVNDPRAEDRKILDKIHP